MSRLIPATSALLKDYPLKLITTDTFGRALVANRPIKYDEIILIEPRLYTTRVADDMTQRLQLHSLTTIDAQDCASLVGQVLLRRLAETTVPTEWLELELTNSVQSTLIVEETESDKIAFEHLTDVLQLHNCTFWNFEFFCEPVESTV